MNDVVREFLIETHENLAQLDQDLVTLEREPSERETLARVFRTLHTVKGTAGFLGLEKLQAVAHAAENLLSRLREGKLTFNAEIASALLAVVDAVRQMLEAVEATEADGYGDYSELIQLLETLRAGQPVAAEVEKPRPEPRQEEHTLVRSAPPPGPSKPPDPAPRASTVSPPALSPPSLIAEAGEARSQAVSDSSIRLDVGLLDKLMTLVGELVLARNQIVQFSTAAESPALLSAVQRLNLLTTELQAGVMKTRMQPINTIWSKFPRVVRDLAAACQKQARLELEGQETELDKSIIESIRDPLTHLIRNAVDHGLEPPSERLARGKPPEGRIMLSAFHEGGNVIIEIADDGNGIDPQRVRAKAIQARLITADQADRLGEAELVNLVFLPGFSTTDKVTQFSGRGVGMDVVRSNVEKIGGTVSIESRPGRGTTVTMKIPLTLAIIPALTITSTGDRYAIPQVSLLELVHLEGQQARRGIEQIHGAPVYRLRGNLLPLVFLNQQLGVGPAHASAPFEDGDGDAINIVVLQAGDQQFGLVVDAIHDTEEIVVKPLQKQIKHISIFAGATIMGDGRVALILDVLGLAQQAGVVSGVRERSLSTRTTGVAESAVDRQTVLLFATRSGGRMAIPLALVDRLEEFPRSALERVGPFEVVQYRGEILPLVHVGRVLRQQSGVRTGPRPTRPGKNRGQRSGSTDPLHVVVYGGQGQKIGLVVDRILDIAEATLSSRSPSRRPGVLFTAVVQDRVTEFLDLEGIKRCKDFELLDESSLAAVEV